MKKIAIVLILILTISTLFPIISYAKENEDKGPKEDKDPKEPKGPNENNAPPKPNNEPKGKAKGLVMNLGGEPEDEPEGEPEDEPETLEEMAEGNPYAPPLIPPNKGKAKHLYLFEKDPDTWEVVVNGAWGKLRYFGQGKFVFNGHGLEPGYQYCLIYYPDPWPGNQLRCLGTAFANGGGNVHIKGEFSFDDIPIAEDENVGAKIWLVLSEDLYSQDPGEEANYMDGWNPTEYLFEYNLINAP